MQWSCWSHKEFDGYHLAQFISRTLSNRKLMRTIHCILAMASSFIRWYHYSVKFHPSTCRKNFSTHCAAAGSKVWRWHRRLNSVNLRRVYFLSMGTPCGIFRSVKPLSVIIKIIWDTSHHGRREHHILVTGVWNVKKVKGHVIFTLRHATFSTTIPNHSLFCNEIMEDNSEINTHQNGRSYAAFKPAALVLSLNGVEVPCSTSFSFPL